jgi:hypothetical protein
MLGSELFMTAFFSLTSTRTYGLEQGPIPWGAIQEFCDRNEIEGEQREDVVHHVRLLDNTYLEESRKKAKENS